MKEHIKRNIIDSAIEVKESYIIINRSEQIEFFSFNKSQVEYCAHTISAMSNGKGGVIIVGKDYRVDSSSTLMICGGDTTNRNVSLYPFTKEEYEEVLVLDIKKGLSKYLHKGDSSGMSDYYDLECYSFNDNYYLLIVVQPASGAYVYSEGFAYRRKSFYTEAPYQTLLSEDYNPNRYPNLQHEETLLKHFTYFHRGYYIAYQYDFLGDVTSRFHLFKYFSLDAFLLCLENGSLRFVEPSFWKDRYEDRFYTALYPSFSYNPPKLFATCFTKNRQSEAAWKVYSSGNTGLASRCVQIELNHVPFRDELTKNVSDFDIYEGDVNYFFTDETINTLHMKENEFHRYYFDNFNLISFLRLMLIKRQAYSHEGERRIFLVPKQEEKRNDHNNAETKDIKLSWKKLIKTVYIDSQVSKAELVALKNSALKADIVFENDRIKYSEKEFKMVKKTHIPLVIMDVDKMYDIDSCLVV